MWNIHVTLGLEKAKDKIMVYLILLQQKNSWQLYSQPFVFDDCLEYIMV